MRREEVRRIIKGIGKVLAVKIRRACNVCPYGLACFLLRKKCREMKKEFKKAIHTEEEEITRIIFNEENDPDVEEMKVSLGRLIQRERKPHSLSAHLSLPAPPPFGVRAKKLEETCGLCSLAVECTWLKWICLQIKKIWREEDQGTILLALRKLVEERIGEISSEVEELIVSEAEKILAV